MVFVYLISYASSLLAGMVLLNMIDIAPEAIFEISTKRLAYAMPVMDMAARAGLDGGIILFIWNSIGALVTLSFIYTAMLFNPQNMSRSPRGVRKIFCSQARMKLLCFLPGCLKIEDEALRRLYVWLMVPFISMILLGIETGLSASTAKSIFGSYRAGVISLLPHGIIEIPAFALAGAVAFSAHLLIKPVAHTNRTGDIFRSVEIHRNKLPLRKIVLAVVVLLLMAGLIEAHITQALVKRL